ncbi:hypothetical protein TNCV_4182321 [Trichonephila clavipes]|nr:hypothetical protein TNCV_4182321 [Trichonephila clavipes]
MWPLISSAADKGCQTLTLMLQCYILGVFQGPELLKDWADSSCHQTGNNYGSEYFSLGQPQNHRGHQLLDISGGTTPTVMHQHLNFRKISAQLVPHQLTTEQCNTRMALSLSYLQRYIMRMNMAFSVSNCHS